MESKRLLSVWGCKKQFKESERVSAARSISISISRGVTIIGVSLFCSFPKRAASRQVGTPTAITGIPTVFWLISFRSLPTPEPGEIPLSESCMVVPSLLGSAAAKASITISPSALQEFITPFSISRVSTRRNKFL